MVVYCNQLCSGLLHKSAIAELKKRGSLGRRSPLPSTSSVSFQKKGGFAGTEERPSACDHMRCEFQVSSICYFQNIRYLFNFQIYSCHRQFDKQHIRKSTGSSRTMAQGHWRQRYRCRSSSPHPPVPAPVPPPW